MSVGVYERPCDKGLLFKVGGTLCPELPEEAPATRDAELQKKIIVLLVFLNLS